MFRLIIITLCCIYAGCYDVSPIVQLPEGQIQGFQAQTSRKNLTYCAYIQVPYAAPPVGNLRFQPPQPVNQWSGVLNTTELTKICYGSSSSSRNSEDCLYLDVYTPVMPGSEPSLPVLMNIHGGRFVGGSEFSAVDAAQYVIEQDVIVVSIGYRLGPFGYLSTLDEIIPGNYGLKDQQFALKWIQRNIHLFGGDPKKVTIIGQSAGAASVTYQLLAKNADGLFRGVISQSGTPLNTYAYQRNASDTAYNVASNIDPTFNRNKSSQELLDFLLTVHASEIHHAAHAYKHAPVVEVDHETAIITENMYQAVLNGHMVKVSLLIGMCSEEGLTAAKSIDSWVQRFDNDTTALVDDDMGITNETIKKIVGETIRRMYLPDKDTFTDYPEKAIQYISDNRYLKAPIKFAEMSAPYIDTYLYQFSYHGKLGHNGYADRYKGIGKVMHGEDLQYCWTNHNHNLDKVAEADIRTLDRYITIITNFAKYLNPTPIESELFENVIWPKVTKDHLYYFDLDTNITILENPREFSYSKWVDIFEEYAAKPLISF